MLGKIYKYSYSIYTLVYTDENEAALDNSRWYSVTHITNNNNLCYNSSEPFTSILTWGDKKPKGGKF